MGGLGRKQAKGKGSSRRDLGNFFWQVTEDEEGKGNRTCSCGADLKEEGIFIFFGKKKRGDW